MIEGGEAALEGGKKHHKKHHKKSPRKSPRKSPKRKARSPHKHHKKSMAGGEVAIAGGEVAMEGGEVETAVLPPASLNGGAAAAAAQDCGAKKKKRHTPKKSRSPKASGSMLSVARAERLLRAHGFRVSRKASEALAHSLQRFAEMLLKESRGHMMREKRKRLHPSHIVHAVRMNESLYHMLRHSSLGSGGGFRRHEELEPKAKRSRK
jgi:histone H3/H4